MFNKINRTTTRAARIRRVRAKITGTASRPRLAVFRSLLHISVQLIDDTTGTTLAAVTDKGLTSKRLERAKIVGEKIAQLAKTKNITQAVFDRAGNRYHGRVAAVAEGARSAGLTL